MSLQPPVRVRYTRSCLEHHRGCWQHVPREKETRKYQSTAVDDEEEDEDGDDNDDDGDGQTTSMACRTCEDGDWMAPLWFASLAS